MKHFHHLAILIVFVWAGMVLGISFLEAPIKFQAPNVTLPIGLGIGRLVFSALNRTEIIFCLIEMILLWFIKIDKSTWIFFATISIILLVQTIWLLPILDKRATTIINGEIPQGSSPHLYYVTGEIVKIIALLTLGFKLLKDNSKTKKTY